MTELAHIPVVFRPGTRLPAEIDDPGVVLRALSDALVRSNDPQVSDVTNAASDPSSPIHTAFTWDDMEAADKQRTREAFYLLGSIVDARTGQPIFVSRYRETNNAADVGRIRINVRMLPSSVAPEPPQYTVHVRPTGPADMAQPALVSVPESEVVDHTPEEERSLVIFRRWIEAHRHEPAVLRAALHLLQEVV